MKNRIPKAGLLLAVIFATGLNSALVQAQEIVKSGRYFVAEIEKSFKVGSSGSLRLEEVRGDIEIKSWAKKEIFVREVKKMDVFSKDEAKNILKKSESSYRQLGNDVEIGGEYYHRDWIQSDFTISLPKGYSVDVHTRGGDVSVENIDGPAILKTSGGEIVLVNIGGDIEAKTSGGDIEMKNCSGRAEVKTSGGNLDLADIKGRVTAKTSGGDIRLKRADNDVRVKTSGGSIGIADVKGEVYAKTSGGDIDLENANGDVEVETSGGDINFGNVGGSFMASTSGGDIRGTDIEGLTRVSTSGGSIRLNDVRGAVEARTAGGDIEVEVTLKDFSKPHSADLRTAGGEITIYLPEKVPATIRAEIELADRWEDYNIYSDFPLTSQQELGPDRRRKRRSRFIVAEGEINGGGDLIELRTADGDIHIRKTRK